MTVKKYDDLDSECQNPACSSISELYFEGYNGIRQYYCEDCGKMAFRFQDEDEAANDDIVFQCQKCRCPEFRENEIGNRLCRMCGKEALENIKGDTNE